MEGTLKKIEAKEFGRYAEEMATQEYIRRGYVIKERNWRLGKTEIDIIAQSGDILVIIEVKARKKDEIEALSAITVDKRKRMIRAADAYLRSFQGNFSYRFDIVACSGTIGDFNMKIYEDAFLATDLF